MRSSDVKPPRTGRRPFTGGYAIKVAGGVSDIQLRISVVEAIRVGCRKHEPLVVAQSNRRDY